MTKDWFQKHLTQIRVKADARYTPELNVDLPISKNFDSICRNKEFYNSIRSLYGSINKDFRYIGPTFESKDVQDLYLAFSKNLKDLLFIIGTIKEYNTGVIRWEKVKKKIEEIDEISDKFSAKLELEKERLKEAKSRPREDGGHVFSPSEQLGYDLYHLRKINQGLYELRQLASGSKGELSNNPFLLLNGSAGIGKTHLLCDLVTQRVQNGSYGIVLFGAYFVNGRDFWTQALGQLGLNGKSPSDFLRQLDTLGKESKSRVLIAIDALNENTLSAPGFWKNNLGKIESRLRKYPNLALVASFRNGYENDLLSEDVKKTFVAIEHYGFSPEVIWSAIKSFFKHYNVTFPEVPLLHPEFYNPLFLKFFCQKNKNSKPNLKGHNALKDLFEDFVIEVGLEVIKEIYPQGEKRGQDGKNLLWDGIVKDVAVWMSDNGKVRIPISSLRPIVEKYFPGNADRAVALMERRVLLSRFDWESETFYSFTYNKFSDHIIVRTLLSSFGSTKARRNAFRKGGKIYRFIETFKYDSGILETLCVQVPEFFRKEKRRELFELAPNIRSSGLIDTPFKESLIWREPSTIGPTVISIVQRNIRSKNDFLLEPLLALSGFPTHALNARLLHSLLLEFSMPERDSWWSVFLHDEYKNHSAVDRILQWSWSDEDRSHISDDSIFLISIVLAWFLTTPNRFVRDRATKGLVAVLQSRQHLVLPLLKEFESTNDPYITERLYAMAYGCVLRSATAEQLEQLAQFVYDSNFKDGTPPVHILIRDYARGIIEKALRLGCALKIDEKKIRPPYSSIWQEKIPTVEELTEKYKDPTYGSGLSRVWSSVMYNFGSMEDFGNYVVNSHLTPWSGRKLDKPEPNKKALYESFKETLSADQKEQLERSTNIFFGISLQKLFATVKVKDFSVDSSSGEEDARKDEEAKLKREQSRAEFKSSLGEEQRKYFETEIEPFLDDRGSIQDPLEDFDTGTAQRWIFNRVVEIGYNSKLHTEFDKRVNRYDSSGRSEHKAERIGKKYQWIAYHEFMALVADHFEFKGERWGSSSSEYMGPWTPRIRDMDPSFLMQNDALLREVATFNTWRTTHGKYDRWLEIKSDEEWLKTQIDLPDPKNTIEVRDDFGKDWLILNGILTWIQETPPEHERYDIPVREVFYLLKSFVVKNSDYKKITEWLESKGFGNWLPESSQFYECFIGEYPNSFAFDDLRGDYNIWTKRGSGEDLSVPLVVTDDSYLNEFTLDCSHDGGISVRMPSKWIVNGMNLQHRHLDGRFFNTAGEVVAHSTAVFEETFPSVLLIDKKSLLDFLKENDCSIFWTLHAEKQFIGGSLSGREFKGRLEMSGIYGVNPQSQIVGNLQSKFDPAR